MEQRFYENVFPEPEDLVMINVRSITDMGAYAVLLEYNNIEGMILLSELSKRRFRSVNELIKVGRNEVVMVLRVDKEKGYIDLSKRRVSPEDVELCDEKYSKSRKIYQTVRRISEKCNVPIQEINEKLIWPLYKKYNHAYDALKEALNNPTILNEYEISEDIKTLILDDLKLRLSAVVLKVYARVRALCTGYDGVDAVRTALVEGKKKAENANIHINIKLVAAPEYSIVLSSCTKQDGLTVIADVIETIKTKLETYQGGDFMLLGEIQVIGGEDEQELIERQNISSSEAELSSGEEDEEE